MKTIKQVCFALVLILIVQAQAFSQFSTIERTKIESYAELPKHTYGISSSISELFNDTDAGREFATAVRDDIQRDLDQFEIMDLTTKRDLINAIINAELILGNDSSALILTEDVKVLEIKPSAKVLSHILTKSILAGMNYESRKEQHAAISSQFREIISGADWEMIQNDIKQMKGRFQMANGDFFLGLAESQYGPFVKNSGELSGEQAIGLIQLKAFTARILPYRDILLSTVTSLLDEHAEEKTDIWTERKVDLSKRTDINPVLIGIWDTGVDPDVYPNNVLVRDEESINDVDDDNNGFVDDIHGIAFTWMGDPTTGMLLPLSNQERETVLSFKNHLKGGMESRAGIDSDESRALMQLISSMKPNEVNSFMENFMHYAYYAHGTHVAGITIEGNPAARLAIVRQSWPHETVIPPIFGEHARKHAENYKKTASYLEDVGVRVVCLSWGYPEGYFIRMYERNGIGESADEREKLGKEVFNIMYEGMISAMESTPEILYVMAAGNSDTDVDFERVLPGSIDLPNVVSVGAVDIAGDETSFTSFGKGVDVYANGYQVESKIPGGESIALSGTSQATPQVVNLAAKLLSIEPALQTSEIVELIIAGATAKEGGRVKLINQRKSFELLQKHKK